MKLTTKNHEAGGALLLTMFTCLTVGIVLGSFLTLISARNKVNLRSTAWNAAIPVLEAGIEEALTHLQKVRNDFNITANGWTATSVGGQPVHVKKRTMPDGSYYNVTIYNGSTDSPLIYSQGFVPSPLEKDKFISRLVRVGATNPPNVWVKGIVTTGKISFGGNSIVDGYDTTKGPYNTLSNRIANGGVGTVYNGPNAVSVGNAKIYGTVTTGPDGTIAVGSGGAIGDVDWINGHTGIKPGWTNDNMNAAFPTNSPPIGGPFLAPTAVTSGGSNMYYLANVTNQLSSFSSSSSKKGIVVTGNSVLYITGDLSITGTGFILVEPGASLTLYLGGDAKIGGGGIANPSNVPAKLSIIGLTGAKSISISGNGELHGTINAPQTEINVNGGGQIYGSIIGKTFTSVGGGSVHYDKALQKAGDLLVTSWKEL